MSMPASNPNEPSKMKKILSANLDESIKSRLPRGNGAKLPAPLPAQVAPVMESKPPESKTGLSRYKFLPAFWTIASVMSLTMNIILIAIMLILFRMIGVIQVTANDQVSGLLGGLYNNFVKMDQARITTNIHVERQIPVQFALSVNTPYENPVRVELTADTTISKARVTVGTGGMYIDNAIATIVLPKGTVLPVQISNLSVPVDQTIPIALDVPVDIPLNQTQLHEPFVGLRQVVEPWYCLVEPNAIMNNVQVCPSINH